MGTFIDLHGMRFGKLTVRGRVDRPGLVFWQCACDCGGLTIASTKKLRNGRKRSCGCLWLPSVLAAKTKHGHASNGCVSAELKIWMGMRARCNSPTNPAFERYGGRGIKVCPEWDDFATFLADMGPRPARHSIEREDNDGPYAPWNCSWQTVGVQNRNRRNNVYITHAGKSLCVADAADAAGLNRATVYARLRAGWDADEVLRPISR